MASIYDKKEAGERLMRLQEALKLNSRQMALELEGDPSYLAKAEKGAGISKKYIEGLEEKYQVNREWLLFGRGKMFGDNVPHGTPPKPPKRLRNLGTPIYEAGLMVKNNDLALNEYQTEGPDFFVQIPQYRDCDYGTRATGDRMYPEIRNGDLLICKLVEDHDTVMLGDIYVLQLKGGVQTVSYVHQHDDEKFFLLKARHEKVPDTPMEKSKVQKIWKVRAVFKGL